MKLKLELKRRMFYKLSRLQLRAILAATLFNKHILSACCVPSPAQVTVEDSGIPIFKELQPSAPNWGACQNHLFQRPHSRGESGSQSGLGPGVWGMAKSRGWFLSMSLDVKLWGSERGRHVSY